MLKQWEQPRTFRQRLISVFSKFGILRGSDEKPDPIETTVTPRLDKIEHELKTFSANLSEVARKPKIVIATTELIVVEANTFFFAFPPSQLNHALSYLNPSFDLGMRSFIIENAKAGTHFVDIGANCGTLSGIAARVIGPQGKVIAVEPIEGLGPIIRRNGVLNGPLTPFEVHACCAGAEEGEVSFQVFEFDNRVSTIFAYGDIGTADATTSITAKVRPAKDLIPTGDNPLFIKIDAEGNEMAILASLTGSDSPIGNRETIIVFEYAEEHFKRAGTDPAKLVTLLDNLNVSAQYMNPVTGAAEKTFGPQTVAEAGNLIMKLPNGLPSGS